MMNWTAFSAIATAVTGFILFGTLVAILHQISKQNRANRAQAFTNLIGWVQREEIRLARRKLFLLRDKQKKLEHWEQDEIMEVEKVCHTYDTVGIMWREKIVPERILAYWSTTITESWDIAELLVTKYREERRNPRLWESFENLANRMKELRK